MARNRGLEFRVYIEGVRLPVQPRSVFVESVFGLPARVSVSLPPVKHTYMTAMKVRTHVAVFWRDLDDPVSTDDHWRLLGEGEVTGYRHGKSASGFLYSDFVVDVIDNHWATTYAMTFTSAQTFFSSQGGDNRLIFGTNGNVTRVIDPSGGKVPLPIETDIQAFVKQPGQHVPELFVSLLKSVRDVSEIFKSTDDRLKIVNRLAYVPDEEIKGYIERKKLQFVLNTVFTSYPPDGRLLTILQAMLANVSYVYQSSPMPTMVGGKLKQFFLIPDLPFMAPPRCNVFFSSSVTTWAFGRNFLVEPTRARFTMNPMSDDNGSFFETFYAPPEMQGLADKIIAAQAAGQTIDGLVLREGVRPESREDEKGVIPMAKSFEAYDIMTVGSDEEDPDAAIQARRRYLCGLVEFELLLAQHRPRELTLSMPFNPNVVAGFPGVFIDDTAIIFGRIQRVAHNLSAEGAPETQVTMDTCREEDFSDVTVPTWKNKRFAVPAQLDATYESFFGAGHKSILAPAQVGATSVGSQHTSQIRAAREILRVLSAMEDPLGFTEAYSARSIVTLQDYMRFVGARAVGGNYTGGPFRGEWATPATSFAQALSVHAQDVT